ncbi:hypothetical protein AOLI_G00180730 [Acnodon oligacanthus]
MKFSAHSGICRRKTRHKVTLSIRSVNPRYLCASGWSTFTGMHQGTEEDEERMSSKTWWKVKMEVCSHR